MQSQLGLLNVSRCTGPSTTSCPRRCRRGRGGSATSGGAAASVMGLGALQPRTLPKDGSDDLDLDLHSSIVEIESVRDGQREREWW